MLKQVKIKLIESEIFTFKFFNVKVIKTAIGEKVVAQIQIVMGDYFRQQGAQVKRFFLDVMNDGIKQIGVKATGDLAAHQQVTVQFFQEFILLGYCVIARIAGSNPVFGRFKNGQVELSSLSMTCSSVARRDNVDISAAISSNPCFRHSIFLRP